MHTSTAYSRCLAGSLLFLSLLVLFPAYTVIQAQDRPAYFDGPYIFEQEDSLQIKWIERGIPHDSTVARSNATLFQRDSLPIVDLQALDFPKEKASTYTDVERVIAISDVHGQYELMRELLLTSGVIDSLNNWVLGEGHLVIIGDNFDRGEEVLSILWLFFQLEQQALKAGGRLHILLGNHELMVLQGDLRYLHRKYNYTAAGFRTPYPEFFATGSVLGDWIAQHQVAISINQHLFVHAGISPQVLSLDLSLEEMNRLFREDILHQDAATISADPILSTLNGDEGPLWYRGYFGEEPLSIGKFRRQLRQYDQQKIIVGHTSQEEIETRYDGQLITVDCSIKLGRAGQVLILEGNSSYIIDQDGETLPLTAELALPTSSLQQQLMASSSRPLFILRTDYSQLLQREEREEYQAAELQIQTEAFSYDLVARVRTRGNMRKQVCHLPPLMIDLRKSELDSLGYVRNDKLKLVVPCHNRGTSQETLYKEFLAYELYRLIDDHGLQTRLVDIKIISPQREYELTGFLIETEEDYSQRTGARALQSGVVSASVVDRQRFVRMLFFQYMIANADWSVFNKHNLELVAYPDNRRPELIAYDFDYSGFVGNFYAEPSPGLPIRNVHERYFFPYRRTEAEIDDAITYFLELETDIYASCAAADYLDEKARESCRDYLRPFFELLRNPQRLKRAIRN